ncbi:hypothetical protein HYZ78_02935 [Candidatus Microgenomates bacterium]|nr:hypothetical protein [Candidatus Microgenomates bacterium]
MPAIQGIQILLAAVVLTLTGLLVFIGVQVIFILKDARRAVKKANRVLDKQTEDVSTFGFLSRVIGVKPQVISENKMPTDDVAPRGDNPFGHIQTLQERGREMFGPRVFHRKGKPLA